MRAPSRTSGGSGGSSASRLARSSCGSFPLSRGRARSEALLTAREVTGSVSWARAPPGPSRTRARNAGRRDSRARGRPPVPPESSLDGTTIAIDPGHNGRNWAHPEEINRLVDAGTLRKACDTTGRRRRRATRSRRSPGTWRCGCGGCCARPAPRSCSRAHRMPAGGRASPSAPPSATARVRMQPCPSTPTAARRRAAASTSSIRTSIRGLTADIARPSKCLALAVRRTYRAGTGLPYATYLGGNGLSVRSDLGGLEPLRRAQGVRGDREHAEPGRRAAAREPGFPRAHRPVDRRRPRAVPFPLLRSVSGSSAECQRGGAPSRHDEERDTRAGISRRGRRGGLAPVAGR